MGASRSRSHSPGSGEAVATGHGFRLGSAAGRRRALEVVRAVATGEGSVRLDVTFLDSHDWRLYRQGLVLRHEARRGGGVVVLHPLGRSDGVTLPVDRPPTGPGDMPAGPTADRIARLVAPRALVPVGLATVDQESWAGPRA